MKIHSKKFASVVAALVLVSAGFTISHAVPVSAAAIDSVPDQSGCEAGGSAGSIWGSGTGGRTRPVVASMTVGGETVADPVHIADHKLGVAICTPFSNARIVGLNVVHREGSSYKGNLTGAQTPSGLPITADTPISITLTNMGSQAKYFTDNIIHGNVQSYTTTGLGTDAASLSFTIKPARTPVVDDAVPGSNFCTATPPTCNVPKSAFDMLAVNMAMDMDESAHFLDMAGSYFGLTGTVGGYVTAENDTSNGGRYLKATLGGPHALADGTTPNVGSMQAFLPTNVLSSLLDIDASTLTDDDLTVTRTEGSTSDDAPFTVTPVAGGAVINVSNITFSTPVYSIASSAAVSNGGGDEGDDPTDLGYHLVAGDGGVFNYQSTSHGSAGGLKLAAPIVGGEAGGDFGYWEVAADGGVFAYGDMEYFGGMGGKYLASPIVGMARTPDAQGYWLVAADGGVFAYGDAEFYGSMGGQKLNKPIVSIAAAVDGGGYTLFASDGGTFNFGSAQPFGSAASLKLAAPIVGGVLTQTGEGYWMVGADGGVFAYGDAEYLGTPKSVLAKGNKVVGMVGTGSNGYAVAGADGAVYAYGTQPFAGGANGIKLAKPIVGIFQGGFH